MQQSSSYLNDLENKLHLPIPLGPFSRVLVNYHKNWGLNQDSVEYPQQLQQADNSYVHEYASSTGSRMTNIGSVSIAASGRNYSRELNVQNGTIVANIAYDIGGQINITDLGGGSGITTELAYEAMKKLWQEKGRSLDDLRDRLYITFVEPSKGMMRDAVDKLDSLGIRYTLLNIPADQVPAFMQHDNQDICMETAALHHYSDPQKPYTAANKVLKKGGYFILNEWCHSLFEHPLIFRELLETLQWPEKDEDMQKYNSFFGLEETDIFPEPTNSLEREANKRMLEWYANRFRTSVDYVYYTLEAHCPPSLILENLKKSGFTTENSSIDRLISEGIMNNNPHLVYPESSLHSSIVVVKL